MPSGHNDYVATPQLNQFQAAYTPLDETNYQGAQSAGANLLGAGANESMGVGQQQGAFAQSLQNQINGVGGPSIAQQQLASGLQQNQAQAAGAIASQRGLNPALAARLIGNAQATAGQQAAGQSAMLRSQEMLNAQNQLGGVLSAQRQGALGQGQLGGSLFSNAGQLQQGQNQTRIQNNLGTQGMNLQAALANQNAQMGAQGINAGVSQANTNASNAITGSVLGAAGAVAGGVLGGPAGAALGAGAGKAVAGSVAPTGGYVPQNPNYSFAQGGQVPAPAAGMSLSDGGRIRSFAEMVAEHLTAQSHAAHDAMFGPVQQSLAKGGKVRPVRSEEDQPLEQIFKGEDETPKGSLEKEQEGMYGGGIAHYDGGGSVSGGPLQQYQAAIAGGQDPLAYWDSLSNPDRKTLAQAGGVQLNGFSGLNQDNIVRDLAPINQAISIPASQKQQAVPGVHEFDPGNFGGLATAGVQQPAMGNILGRGFGSAFPGGFMPPASPGPLYRPPPPVSLAPTPMRNAAYGGAMNFVGGGHVPGLANVAGDSPKNDTVHAMLSPGEVVLPRSVSNHPEKAKAFVKHLISSGQLHPHELK